MKICSARQVREIDRLTIQSGTDGLALMQNAARAVYETIVEKTNVRDSVCILCGCGNNAGDGFALARLLVPIFQSVTVMLLCGNQFSPDAAHYFDKLCKEVKTVDTVPAASVYVDAVFGTGFRGDLAPEIQEVFSTVNQQRNAVRVAIDVPSGIACDCGDVSVNSFMADFTVTFEILKVCHVLPNCRDFCGEIVVKQIGLSKEIIKQSPFLAETIDTISLPVKAHNLHKGTAGTLFAVVGCREYQGAASLSTLAALRSGCGIVSAFVPESIYAPVAAKVFSAILVSCPENRDGIHLKSTGDILAAYAKKRKPTAILLGSGMGRFEELEDVIRCALQIDVPTVVDGDGLYYVTKDVLKSRCAPTVLTPHIGEFANMCQMSIDAVLSDRFLFSRQYAADNNVVLVLKDSVTIVTAPNGAQFLLNVPNPGLAKGGSGDVLAGLIAGLLAQGLDACYAARAGVWIHSKAAAYTAENMGHYAMLPEDIISNLHLAL